MGAVSTLWHRGSGWRNVTIAAVFLTALALIYPPRLDFGRQPSAAPRIPASSYTPATPAPAAPPAAIFQFPSPAAGVTTSQQAQPVAPAAPAPLLAAPGLHYGQTYSGTVPIGGRAVPLPPGMWTVIGSIPGALPNGDRMDDVVLANIDGPELRGLVSLVGNGPSTPTVTDQRGDKSCFRSRNLFAYRKSDPGDARFDCWSLIAANTKGWPVPGLGPAMRAALGDLTQRGVKLPPILLQASFRLAAKGQLLIAVYFFNPDLDHVSAAASNDGYGNLGDWARYEIAAHPQPLAYAARVKAWMQSWGDALDQGFTGQLREGPLPAPWADLGFPAATAGAFTPGEVLGNDPPALRTVPAGPLYGHAYTAAVPFGDRRLPLPAGTWTAIARIFATSPEGDQVEATALVKIASGKVAGLIILTGNAAKEPTVTDYRSKNDCERGDNYVARAVETADGAEKGCLSANFAVPSVWRNATGALFLDTYNELKARGISIPDALLWARLYIATQHHELTAIYYFNPELEGIQSTPQASEWNKFRLADDPRKSAYADGIKAWLDGWQPILRASFAAGFADQTRPPDPLPPSVKTWPTPIDAAVTAAPTAAPATAPSQSAGASPRLAATIIRAPNRIAIAAGLYLDLTCAIASGNGPDDAAFWGLDKKVDDADALAPGIKKSYAGLKDAFKSNMAGVQRGWSYCLVTKWSSAIGGRPLGLKLILLQKTYASGKQSGPAILVPADSCKGFACIQIVKGVSTVDGITTCLEVPANGASSARSLVVGVGKYAGLVDADRTVRDGACATRKF